MTYEFIDSGEGQKLERFGDYTLIRPCPQAIWKPQKKDVWQKADAQFSREGKTRWTLNREIPLEWIVAIGGVRFKVSLTEFGHLGVFPEHAEIWTQMRAMIRPKMRVLNLFAYSGGVTLAAAQEGAEVCHLDAAKGMVEWARKNAALNGLEDRPIRWIVDDAMKFIHREMKRQSLYEGIILDPPTFGRGAKGEVFKIEQDLIELLEMSKSLLSKNKRFLILSCHTPMISTLVIHQVMEQIFGKEHLETNDFLLKPANGFSVPSGCYAMKEYG